MAVHVAVVGRGAVGSAHADDGDEQHLLAPPPASRSSRPTQDITLGSYYVTAEPRKALAGRTPWNSRLFGSKEEVHLRSQRRRAKTHDRIRLANPDSGKKNRIRRFRTEGHCDDGLARVFFSEIWAGMNSVSTTSR